MTIHVFTIRQLETGRLVGQAVVCAPARYASVLWHGAERPDRRFAALAEWQAIDRELALQLPPEPLESTNPIVVLLARERGAGLAIQYLYQDRVPEDGRGAVDVAQLDLRLRQTQER